MRRRVHSFLDHLAANPDKFRVTTCGDLVTELVEARPSMGGDIPNLGFVHPFTRKVVQALNSIYWL